MSGIFHSGGFDPPPMLSGKYPCYFFGVWNPFISTFRAFLDFTLIKVDEVGGGGGGGGGGWSKGGGQWMVSTTSYFIYILPFPYKTLFKKQILVGRLCFRQ